MSELEALLGLVQTVPGPFRSLDARIHQAFNPELAHMRAEESGYLVDTRHGLHLAPVRSPRYTQSLDDAIALLQKCLPGWWWTCGDCQLTHDASIAIPGSNGIGLGNAIHAIIGPDFRASEEMQALLRRRPDLDGGIDVDRVGGNVALAIVEAVLEALLALSQQAEAA